MGRIATLMGAVALTGVCAGSAGADVTPVLDAHVAAGAAPDATALGRLLAGGMLVFDELRLAVDGHLSFAGFLRVSDDEGVSARSFGINLGARHGFGNERFHGPYVALGAGYGLFTGEPKERKISGDMEVCVSAEDCTIEITQHLNGRAGVGWGFASGKQTTVGVRLDLMYWAFALADGDEQPGTAPYPGDVPRPHDTFTVMLGLEFMYWGDEYTGP